MFFMVYFICAGVKSVTRVQCVPLQAWYLEFSYFLCIEIFFYQMNQTERNSFCIFKLGL